MHMRTTYTKKIARFSSKDKTFEGMPLGDAQHDNRSQIMKTRFLISQRSKKLSNLPSTIELLKEVYRITQPRKQELAQPCSHGPVDLESTILKKKMFFHKTFNLFCPFS